MASRLFWIFLAGAALVAGMAVQDRWLFDWGSDAVIEARIEQAIETRVEDTVETRVEETIDGSLERMQVLGSDGRAIEVRPETKRELGQAVRRVVAAETGLALMRVRGASDAEMQDSRSRRDSARADLERLKGEIERQEQMSESDRDLMRQQIQQEIRTTVRETIRSAVRG